MASPLDRVIDHLGGDPRPGQIRMHEAAVDAASTGTHLLVEAPTGVGKSLAYLTAIATSDKRTVIATSTLALQDQLATKDMPAVEAALGQRSWAVAKGRSNYLCRVNADATYRQLDQGELFDIDDATTHIRAIRSWEATTTTGDRAELDVPDTAWSKVSINASECPGASNCSQGENCFAVNARRHARDADIVITNTALLAAHLTSGGRLLGDRDLVVIDEAHDLIDIATTAYGIDIGPGRLHRLAHLVRGLLTDPGTTDADLDRAAHTLAGALERATDTPRIDLTSGPLADALTAAHTAATATVDHLSTVTLPSGDATDRAATITSGAENLIADIIAAQNATDADAIWIEETARTSRLRVAPIDPANNLARDLFSNHTVIACSATLAVGGDLTWAAHTFGLVAGTQQTPTEPDPTPVSTGRDQHPYWEHLDASTLTFRSLIVDSPFDYDRSLLYCATDLPDPRQPTYREAVRSRAHQLITAAGGRALVLCTSTSAGQEMASYLRDRLHVNVIDQWTTGKRAAIRQFTDDETSVLVATMGFWQGVDVPGRACSLVIIDRLPFGRVDDPLTQARRNDSARRGENPFVTIDVPRAARMLAQGAGRLIRTSTDQGVVAILDPRLATARSYRWTLINSLPPMPRTGKVDEAVASLQAINDTPELHVAS